MVAALGAELLDPVAGALDLGDVGGIGGPALDEHRGGELEVGLAPPGRLADAEQRRAGPGRGPQLDRLRQQLDDVLVPLQDGHVLREGGEQRVRPRRRAGR